LQRCRYWTPIYNKTTKKKVVAERRAYENKPKKVRFQMPLTSLTRETKGDQELRDNLLATIREKQVGRTKNILIIVDSGACDHVMPRRMFERIPATKGIAAENEIMYVTADGGRIPSLGEQKLSMRVEGRKIVTTFQVADVNKPILSVTKFTEDGNEVKFSRRGGTI
jgi:hypothetical protein